MNLPSPKAIIFDWDNTLVDTWPVIHAALNATFDAWGMQPWTLQQTKTQVSKSMRDSFPAIFGDEWQKAGEYYRQQYRARHLQQLKMLPGAEAVLHQAHARGLINVVVSNKLGPSLREEVVHMGWEPYFDRIVGSDDAARDKPHPDPVHLALEKSRIPAGPDVWFVGDSEVDLECAEACGCTAILYGASARDHEEYSATHYRGFPYHAHVHDHEAMLRLLREL